MQLLVEIQKTQLLSLVIGNDGEGLYFVPWYYYK